MLKAIKLMSDYGCSPLWAAGDAVGNLELDSLPLSSRLRTALRVWADSYDRTLDRDDPRKSGFRSTSDAAAFDAEGRRLLAELRRELPGTRISYFSVRDHRLHD